LILLHGIRVKFALLAALTKLDIVRFVPRDALLKKDHFLISWFAKVKIRRNCYQSISGF
jgi:hypothetical protein